MATVTGLTAERMQEIIDKTIVDADVVGGHLILTLDDGSTMDAGSVIGPQGPPASNLGKGNAFPAGATDGDLYVRTDQVGDPLYKFTDGAWAAAGGGLNKVTSFPSAPQDGDAVIRTDLNGSPIFAYSTENGWEQSPRMGAVTVSRAKAVPSANQSIPNNTTTTIALATELWDTDAMHDTVTNNSRITFKTPGTYLVVGGITWDPSSAVGPRWALISKNGSQVAIQAGAAGSDGTARQVASCVLVVAAGDYVELQGQQGSGAALSIIGDGTEIRGGLQAVWLGGVGQTVDERGVPAFASYISTDQSIPANVYTKLPFNTKDYDTDNAFDTSNWRFTVKTPGLYRFDVLAVLQSAGVGTGAGWIVKLYKNGASYRTLLATNPTGFNPTYAPSVQDQAAAGDYYEVFVYNAEASVARLVYATSTGTRFEASLVGSGKTVTPYAKIHNTTGPSIPNDILTTIAMDGELSDNDNAHDTVTNNSRWTCRTAGVYLFRGLIGYNANSTGLRGARILKNGVGNMIANTVLQAGPAPDGSWIECVAIEECAVGDYVELQAWQKSGGSLGLVVATGLGPGLEAIKIGAPISGPTGIEAIEVDHVVGAAGEPAFQSGFSNYGISGFAVTKFYKDRGRVYLRGTLNNAGAAVNGLGSPMFVLPAGYRPSEVVGFPANANNAFGVVRVDPSGVVYLAVGNSQLVQLDGFSFRL